MKHILIAATLALAPVAAHADGTFGTWITQDEGEGRLHVKFGACGDKICGKIVKAISAEGAETTDYEHIGKNMVAGMSAAGGGSYKGGTIWDPSKNKKYKSKMSLSGNSLKVSGCVGPICRGQTWTRVK